MSNVQNVEKLAAWVYAMNSNYYRYISLHCDANVQLVWDWVSQNSLSVEPQSVVRAFESFLSTGSPSLAIKLTDQDHADLAAKKAEVEAAKAEKVALEQVALENETFALQNFIAAANEGEATRADYIRNRLAYKSLDELRVMAAEIKRRREISALPLEEIRKMANSRPPRETYDGIHPVMPAKWTGGREGTIAQAKPETIRNLNRQYGAKQVNERLNKKEQPDELFQELVKKYRNGEVSQ